MHEEDLEKSVWDSATPLETSDGIARDQSSGSQASTACDENAGTKTTELMEEVLRKENLTRAYERVKGNHGAPGVDGMTVEELMPYCQEHWAQIREQILNGTYQPRPIKRVDIPKADGKGTRMLGIPVVLDRLIQQAIMQVLTPIYDPTFSENSHGFRPGRSTWDAVRKAREYIKEGYDWVVDTDLEKFFDRVNQDVLMARIARRIKDKRLLLLIRRFLQAGMMEEGIAEPRREGVPQGSPLSPLLSNILLDELDKELELRGHHFCRYADDCNIYVKSEAAGQRVMTSVEEFLLKRLRLKINRDKSAVARPWERRFLGYSFTKEENPRITVSPKSVERFRKKLKPLWKKGRGQSIKMTIKKLNQIISGWASYYRLSEVPWPFKDLDGWIRRRIRWIFWRQWKKPRTRLKKLIKLGIPHRFAAAAAWSKCGPWPISSHWAMQMAFNNPTLKNMGLKSLFDEYRRFVCFM